MVHILSLVLIIVLLYFVSIIKYYVKDSYAAITIFWACNNYRPSQKLSSVSRKYSVSLANIHRLSQNHFRHFRLQSRNVEILWQGVVSLAHEEAAFSEQGG